MVSEKEGAGPISYGGVARLAPSTTKRKCGLTQSIVPADTVNVGKGKIGFWHSAVWCSIIQGNRRLTVHAQGRRKHGAVLGTIKTKPLRGAFGPS